MNILLADYTEEELAQKVAKASKSAIKETLSLVEDKMGAVFLWSAVAFIGLALLGALVIYLCQKDKLRAYGKAALTLAVGFALAIAVSGVALTLVKYDIRGSLVPTMVYPLFALAASVVLGGLALAVVNAVAKDKLRLAFWIVAGICAVPLIVSLVYLSLYFRDEIQNGGYYVDVSTLALVLSSVGLVILAVVVPLVCGKKGERSENTRSIAYAGVSVALAFALSYVKLFRMPQGGSVTLASMLPIMLYSCRFGTRKGVLAGLVYGLLQAVQDPYIIHPAQFLLDYPLAFTMLGLAGWASEIKLFGRHRWAALLVGAISAFFMRYIAHVLSGIFAFAAYAYDAEFTSPVVYSFLYNTYVLIDGALCLGLGIMMYLNKGSRKLLLNVDVTTHSSHRQEDEDEQANADVPSLEGTAPEESLLKENDPTPKD